MKEHTRDLFGLLIGTAVLIAILIYGCAAHAQSINHIYYEPKNCHKDGEFTRCSHVVIEFFGISAKVEDSGPGPAVELVNRQHPQGPAYEYHYVPAKCKPIKDTKFHACSGVYWREINQ